MADDKVTRVEVVKEQVRAQVAPPRDPDPDKVDVHETSVATDRVITDPTAPDAVQVPDEGKGSLALPIHNLVDEETGEARQTPNEALDSVEEQEVSDEDRERAATEGSSAYQAPQENND